MSVPHSSTPWHVSRDPVMIRDTHNNHIVTVVGSNEQSIATAAHIVECVNRYEGPRAFFGTVDSRELATILHALRSMQENQRLQSEDSCFQQCDHFDETNTPLNVEEIDALCERLNA